MTAYGGITQRIQVLEETTYADGGLTGEVVFGATRSFEWRMDTHTQQTYALESDSANPTFNTDGVLLVTGSHEWEFTSGKELKAILGTLSGATTFTLDIANTLPSYSVKVVDGDGYRIIKGLKYEKFTLTMQRGDNERIVVKADWQAQQVADTTTFTPTVVSTLPLTMLDGYVSYGATAQTDLDAFSLEIARTLTPRRFIENVSAGSKRFISALIEGILTVTFSGTQGAKTALVNELYGGATQQDVRSDKTITLNLARTGATALVLNITGARMTTLGRTMKKDDEISLGEFGGVGLSVNGTGTYPN